MQRRPMHLGGRRCALPPTPLQPFFLKVASSHCHIASKNITKKKHKKKTKHNKKKQHMQRHPMHLAGRRCALPTKNDTKKTQMQRRPMHLSKNTAERNNKCKNTQCIWGGGASHSHITKKINENKKKYRKNEVSHLYFFVLKLPCLDVETDAKNPRQAGTVAKKPRGTDAKNPPQLAPLQKTPVTV